MLGHELLDEVVDKLVLEELLGEFIIKFGGSTGSFDRHIGKLLKVDGGHLETSFLVVEVLELVECFGLDSLKTRFGLSHWVLAALDSLVLPPCKLPHHGEIEELVDRLMEEDLFIIVQHNVFPVEVPGHEFLQEVGRVDEVDLDLCEEEVTTRECRWNLFACLHGVHAGVGVCDGGEITNGNLFKVQSLISKTGENS